MKKTLTLVSTLVVASALSLTACNKDKKPATTQPTNAEPAATEPAKTEPEKTEPTAAEPKADDKPKGGW
jgi:hypothetical protein